MDLKQNQIFQCGGSNDHVENSADSTTNHSCLELGSRTYSTSSIHLTTLSSTPTSRHQSKPKGYNSEDNLCEQSPEVEFSRNKQHGSSDCIHGRSESLSSEDMVPSRDTPALPRGSHISHSTSAILSSNRQDVFLHRSGSGSFDIPQRSNPTHSHADRQRSASPGSEMVTLEEFLEESNRFSPPNDTSGSRDDLLSDYFKKANEPSPIGNQLGPTGGKETAKMPTSYVSPTVKMPIASEEERVAKPGHCVKPNLRPAESESLANSTGSLKLPPTVPHQALSGVRQTAQSQQTSMMSQRTASLSRAFSLASADLLRATGPEMYRQESPQKLGAGVRGSKDPGSQTFRLSMPSGSHSTIRDRPQSAKASGALQGVDSRCRQLDARRLSLAPSKEERPLSFHLSSASASANNMQERVSAVLGQLYSPTQYTLAKVKSKPAPRSGEVATVTPVRAASSKTEGSITPGQSPSDALDIKCRSRPVEDHGGAGGIEESNRGGCSKSTPGSPDPQGDQQTVWYEYGCV